MFRFLVLASVLLVGSVSAQAADDARKLVADALHKVAPQAKIESILESSLPGYYAAIIDGHVIYVSADGKYLIEGMVYDVQAHRDMSDEPLAGLRKQGIARIAQNQRLVFAPPNPKYKVTVFTDVDCPYCRQFHKQIAEYNHLGIEVDYVLFPLSIHPGADKKAQTVWCSADRNSAYTAAMNGQTLAPKTCDNPIGELTSVALSMGLNGTPAIVADDGSQLGGYVSPQDLAQRLQSLAPPPQATMAK
ncbi:MAG: DsbC family protein [Rudaea sp.]|nr:DsbC family protein [Rudaea sp.]